MKIGKFKIELQYDMQCDICGEYRSNIFIFTLNYQTNQPQKN